MQVQGLEKHYSSRGPRWSSERSRVQALEAVDLTIMSGAILAVVGESGSGKSTLARCLARLETPSAGRIWFEGTDIAALAGPSLVPVRRSIQLIFQDPATALNPRFPAWEIVAEPLTILRQGPRQQRRFRAIELMEQVGLSPQAADRRPLEFSGGQRQRLAIARALAAEPKLLILDEALSALDVSMQAQIVDLLLDLQQTRSLTYLLISHDLGLVADVADEAVVLYQGRIVERGRPAALLERPQHAHTCALAAAFRLGGTWLGESPLA
jgi:ABC-type glutathione transport system ATPase component